MNPLNFQAFGSIKYDLDNYHVITAQICTFKEIQEDHFLIVSVVKKHDQTTNRYESSSVLVYGLDSSNKQITFVHQTNLEDICYSIQSFQGKKVLLGAGGFLRLYSLGKKQLLLKSEFKKKFKIINNIRVSNDRVFISDATDSIHLIKYNDKNNQFYEVADDLLPKYVTSMDLLDYHSAVIADKFGNISVQRLPQNSDQEYTEDSFNYRFTWEQGYLNGAPVKFDEVVRFYLVNLITDIQEATLIRSNQKTIIYGDIEGKIGLMLPLELKNHLDFFVHFEMLMRDEFLNLTDRNQLVFRSYYGCLKGVIDYDLCLQYFNLPQQKRKAVAEKLERSVEEVENMLLLVSIKLLF